METLSLNLNPCTSRVRSCLPQPKSRALARKIIWHWKQEGSFRNKGNFVDCASLVRILRKKVLQLRGVREGCRPCSERCGKPFMEPSAVLMLPILNEKLAKRISENVGTGFRPDLTTFNIRAVAYSRMSLFWDLHLSLEHMRHEHVVPDLVTYGCVVDAYLDKRLGRNLDFAFSKMNLDDSH
ncbi:hypothetical protein LWI28_016998 [Acer negundo]|uniref:Uncharacterized protein n=1 Tax=Acer negundo TaxID=4023 RepID=A0AAD5JA04_ACENE|nr:hypothetical protein LWI28_016998 [Acer negundo]